MTEDHRLLGGRYQLGDVIGRGGMAEVHRGNDLRLTREVAIKILRQDLARDPSFIARFRREAQAAAALNHPNVVSVYDTGEDEVDSGIGKVTVPWIVMEYVDGITLRQVLQSGHKIEPERALDITTGILAALDYSHRHGIIHRDIKPGNVMLNRNGAVKVMDFGIARAVADASATMTHTNTVMGTAQYLSPEQARGEVVDARSDIYSTGCVLYELLTGRAPFVGDSPMAIAYQHVAEALVPPSHINPEVPVSYDAVLAKAMAKSPDERYANAAEMRADVERLIHGEATHADRDATTRLTPIRNGGKVSTRKPVSGGASNGQAKLIGAIGLVVALVVGAIYAVMGVVNQSNNQDQVTVPSLAGLTAEQVTQELGPLNLAVGTTNYQEDDTHPAGTVISQDPPSGTRVDKGSAVNIVLAKVKAQVAVPTLANFASPDDARTALIAANLTLGAVNFEDSDLPANTVLRSDPAAGTMVDAGTAIAIWVSSGKTQVPDVTQMDEAAARDALYNLGFLVTTVYLEDDTVAEGTVLSQDPQPGVSMAQGTTVTITVSKLPADPSQTPLP